MTDEAGEKGPGLWAIDAPRIGKIGLPAAYVRLGAGEPGSETVQQLTADGVAMTGQNKY